MPLPPAPDASWLDAAATSAYAAFCPGPTAARHKDATFRFGPNYATHVPDKTLISQAAEPTANGSESRYALRLPLVRGTVVGYSPPLRGGD